MTKNVRVKDDPDMPLSEWLGFIQKMIRDHGMDAYMYVDSGYNNSQLVVSKDPPNIGTGRPT